jgi:hypothetical protein
MIPVLLKEKGHAVVRRHALDLLVWALGSVLAVAVGLVVARLNV